MRGVVMVPGPQRDVLWIDRAGAMNHADWNAIFDAWPATPQGEPHVDGAFDRLGGVFVSAPAGVARGNTQLDVFGLGTDYSVYHKAYDSVGKDGVHWTADWEDLGGDFTCTPVVLSPDGLRIDLFGLTSDQTMVHRGFDGSGWGAWESLGGGFTSMPSVLAAPGGGFDLFARGMDFLVWRTHYAPGTIPVWTKLGGGLLGEPVAASMPVAVRVHAALFVFIVADNGSMASIEFDGRLWRPWQPIIPPAQDANGTPIAFIAEPTVVAFVPQRDLPLPPVAPPPVGNASARAATARTTYAAFAQPAPALPRAFRIDVFGVGADNRLFHKWLDPEGWHGASVGGVATQAWEVLPLLHECAPSAVAAGHASSPFTVPPADVALMCACTDGIVRGLLWQGGAASAWPNGPVFALPGSFQFSADAVQIDTIRSQVSDTDHCAVTLSVGKWLTRNATFELGDVGTGGRALFNLRLHGAIELCEPVVFTHAIVNSGNSDLAKTVVTGILAGAASFAGDQIKGLVNPPNTTTALTLFSDDIQRLTVPPNEVPLDIVATTAVLVGGSAGLPGLGSVLGAVLAAGINAIVGVAFADCDGIVAAGSLGFPNGRRVRDLLTGAQADPVRGQSHTAGSDSPSGCFGNSSYTVYWSIGQARIGP